MCKPIDIERSILYSLIKRCFRSLQTVCPIYAFTSEDMYDVFLEFRIIICRLT